MKYKDFEIEKWSSGFQVVPGSLNIDGYPLKYTSIRQKHYFLMVDFIREA